MLKSLEPYEMMNLADALERRYYSNGECIIKQGDSADAFYIVEDGMVKISKEDPVSIFICVVDTFFTHPAATE